MKKLAWTFLVLFFLLWAPAPVLPAQDTGGGDVITKSGSNAEEALAKAAQNPVADMISLPLQNNTNFNFGPKEKNQNILNVQPVWPFSLNEEWNLITRTIVPVISQPELFPDDDRENGIGDTTFTAFISPATGQVDLGGGTCPAAAHGYGQQTGHREMGCRAIGRGPQLQRTLALWGPGEPDLVVRR